MEMVDTLAMVGQRRSATLNGPTGVTVDAAGNIFIADFGNNVIREVQAATGIITTAVATGLVYPIGVTVDPVGDVFIADRDQSLVREMDHVTHNVTTVAGNGSDTYGGDGGPATSAALQSPNAVALDAAGNLLIADSGNNVVREVYHSTDTIATVAGSGESGYGGDGGTATGAELQRPTDVAVDASGNIFIADRDNNVVREINHATGIITTVAGVGGTYGYMGDGGPATAATLNSPSSIAVDAAGDLFIADTGNNVIREIKHGAGVINTVAGYGAKVTAATVDWRRPPN